jgi:hypothetical protein
MSVAHWRVTLVLGSAFLLPAVGCSEYYANALKERATFDLACPDKQITVVELGGDAYGAQGCGRKASYVYVPQRSTFLLNGVVTQVAPAPAWPPGPGYQGYPPPGGYPPGGYPQQYPPGGYPQQPYPQGYPQGNYPPPAPSVAPLPPPTSAPRP